MRDPSYSQRRREALARISPAPTLSAVTIGRLNALSDDETYANAVADPDAQPLSILERPTQSVYVDTHHQLVSFTLSPEAIKELTKGFSLALSNKSRSGGSLTAAEQVVKRMVLRAEREGFIAHCARRLLTRLAYHDSVSPKLDVRIEAAGDDNKGRRERMLG